MKNTKEKLTRTVAVRMTETEYERLAEMSQYMALSLGAFIRFMLFGSKRMKVEGLADVY